VTQIYVRIGTGPLQRSGIPGQLLIEHAIRQRGAAVILHMLPDRLTGHLLHRPVLETGAPAQRLGLMVMI
jgi:hypothetical protein